MRVASNAIVRRVYHKTKQTKNKYVAYDFNCSTKRLPRLEYLMNLDETLSFICTFLTLTTAFCYAILKTGGTHDVVIKWNIFHVTGHLCGKFTGRRWNPRTKASDAELWRLIDLRLNKRLSKQPWVWWFQTPSHPFWLHCNAMRFFYHSATRFVSVCAVGHANGIRLPCPRTTTRLL